MPRLTPEKGQEFAGLFEKAGGRNGILGGKIPTEPDECATQLTRDDRRGRESGIRKSKPA